MGFAAKWHLDLFLKSSMHPYMSQHPGWCLAGKCCVEILCMSAVVSVFFMACGIDFAFSLISSLSSIGCLDIKVFVTGGFGKPKWQDLFLWQ